jgi:hypothetical protein
MQFIVALLKKLPWVTVLAAVGGLIVGLVFAYLIAPPEFINATPTSLRPDLQEDYLRMAIDSFRVNQNLNLAVDRWKNLGENADEIYLAIQNNPAGMDPNVINVYGQAVQAVLLSEGAGQPTAEAPGGRSTFALVATIGGILALVAIAIAAIFFLRNFLGKRSSGEPTPVMQAAEISRQTEKTNYENLGLATPITQTMTTYVLGDDLYDESFSIDTAAGEFLGEYGVGVSEAIGVGDPKKVTALEIWLFDKNDIKTATKVLMSAHAFQDAGIRSRLEPKGELVMAEPQAQILLETATLQLLATVVDLEYGHGPMPQDSYFERITLELAVWPRGS